MSDELPGGLKPLNMHGHANTFEEELLEVARENAQLKETIAEWQAIHGVNPAADIHAACQTEITRLRRAIVLETLDSETRRAVADLAKRYSLSEADAVREILHWWVVTHLCGWRWPGIDLKP